MEIWAGVIGSIPSTSCTWTHLPCMGHLPLRVRSMSSRRPNRSSYCARFLLYKLLTSRLVLRQTSTRWDSSTLERASSRLEFPAPSGQGSGGPKNRVSIGGLNWPRMGGSQSAPGYPPVPPVRPAEMSHGARAGRWFLGNCYWPIASVSINQDFLLSFTLRLSRSALPLRFQ